MVYLTLLESILYSTMDLLHSTWLYMIVQWLYFILPDSTLYTTMALLHSSWFYMALLQSTLLHSTLLYITLPWLFLTLLYSIFSPTMTLCTVKNLVLNVLHSWLYIHYHGCTLLCLILHYSNMALLQSTLHHSTMALYFTLLDSTISKSFYITLPWLYLTLIHSIFLYHCSTSL